MNAIKTGPDTSLPDAAGRVDTLEAADVEKNDRREALQRHISEAPYSIYGKGMKVWIIFLVSVSALISPFGGTTFLPALNVLSDVLHITSAQVNISITTYMVSQRRAWPFQLKGNP
jgi:hypothetical protein|tara:strand:- start:6198 stop:6545 length:348 start_codon:yes stop_codon:yes gene_type:complete